MQADSAGMRTRLSAAEARARAMAQERDRSETEAAARLRALDAAHQAEMHVLEGRVSELMDALEGSRPPPNGGSGGNSTSAKGGGVPGGGHHQSGGGGGQQLPPGVAAELRLRLRSLESLNARLEEELDAERRRADEAEAGAEALLARSQDQGQSKRGPSAADAGAVASKADRNAALHR